MEEPMSEELRARVLADINMDEQSLKEGVQELRAWLISTPCLPQQLDDTQLESFLVSCKSLEKTKNKIYYGYTHKWKYPQFFEKRNLSADVLPEKCMKTGFVEGFTPDGSRVFVMSLPENKDLKEFDYITAMKEMLMKSELSNYQHPVTRGFFIIVDTFNLSLALLQKISVFATKSTIECYFEIILGRLSGLVLFNAPALTQFAMDTFAKPFMPKKLRDRIFIYKDCEKLREHLPLELIPEDYGGTASSMDSIIARTRRNLEENEKWFETLGSLTADLSKTPQEEQQCSIM